MKAAPEFAPYPLVSPPVYARWLTTGVVLLALVSSVSVLLKPFTTAEQAAVAVTGVALLWVSALLLRTLFYRFNQHNAYCYEGTAAYVRQRWWQHHRQTAALVESVLVSPVCSTAKHAEALFSNDHKSPTAASSGGGTSLRLPSVLVTDSDQREQQLARLLALQWCQQRANEPPPKLVQCYWLGSLGAWQAFVTSARSMMPHIKLPDRPEPWEGIRSLDAVIDRVQGMSAQARIFCGGCQSTPLETSSDLPAGEAALLWVLGAQGSVRLHRGEWYAAAADTLPEVADRALAQMRCCPETKVAVSFSQPAVPQLADMDWNRKSLLQDANFGELGDLQAMAAQTLAAWNARHTRQPCLWLASDPHHTLALGGVDIHE